MVSPQGRREQVRFLQERGLSQRRACGLLDVPRSTLGYRLRQPAKDAAGAGGHEPVVGAVSALRLPPHSHLPAPRGSWPWASIARVGCGARPGCSLPRKRPRRRVAASRPRPLPPRAANHVWAYDFVFDACANGQQLKCLTVVDEFTHECLAIDVAGSIRSARVIDVLTRLMSVHGAPAYLRSDNGPEFVSNAILRLADRRRHRNRPDRPRQAVAERHQRIVQRQVPRRVPERRVVPHPPRGPGHHRGVAAALQRGAPALEPRLLDPARIQAAPSAHSRPSQPSHFPGMIGPRKRTQVSRTNEGE